jgi:CelD/BcsL family acetyltransferase involved in cellulose biosynthesis
MKHATIPAPLTVDVVADVPAFDALRADWQALEACDPQATVFLSWDWLAEAFRSAPYGWSVIVVREATPPHRALCILPLKYGTRWSRSNAEFQTEVQAGGRLLWSEYVGFLCDPDQEDAALDLAAAQLARMPWTRLSMRYVAQADRCRRFTDALVARGIEVRYRDYSINGGETDNLRCPAVTLPGVFDAYLASLSRNRRQQYNRFRRRFLDTEEYRITEATGDTIHADLDALLRFWKAKWRVQKGHDRAERVAENYRRILLAAHRTRCLYLPVLHGTDGPLGALGHVVDHARGRVHFLIVGRDEGAAEPFVGAALHFHAIRWAIAQGYGTYDFCHGDEPYKYGYGAVDTEVLYFEARRREPGLVFDSLCTGAALHQMSDFIAEGRRDRAAAACAQLAALLS